MYGSYGATAPAPVPYDKQTDQFLIGIINKYGPRLREIHNILAKGGITAAEKTKLLDEQKTLVNSYWTPAKTNLEKRGYKVEILQPSQEIKISAPKTAATSAGISSKGGVNPAMIAIALAAAGAYWWFKIRKQPAQA